MTPTESAKAFKASMESLMEAVSGPAMSTAAAGISKLARGIADLSLAAKDHPVAAMAAGTAVAGGALAGAGVLSWQLMNGFGLGASATALDGSAAALTAAAAELGGAGLLGKVPGLGTGPGKVAAGMGALGFLGAGALGIGAIAAGVGIVDATLPNWNRANGYGAAYKRATGLASYPSAWGPGGVNVAGGIGAVASPYATNREKTWSEMFFGTTRGGSKDPTRMELPLPPSMMPSAAPAAAVPGFGGTTATIGVAGADAAKDKLAEVKTAGEDLGRLQVNVPVSIAGAGTAIQQLQQIIALGQQANQTIGSVNAGGGFRARSSPATFSDGATPGAGAP